MDEREDKAMNLATTGRQFYKQIKCEMNKLSYTMINSTIIKREKERRKLKRGKRKKILDRLLLQYFEDEICAWLESVFFIRDYHLLLRPLCVSFCKVKYQYIVFIYRYDCWAFALCVAVQNHILVHRDCHSLCEMLFCNSNITVLKRNINEKGPTIEWDSIRGGGHLTVFCVEFEIECNYCP